MLRGTGSVGVGSAAASVYWLPLVLAITRGRYDNPTVTWWSLEGLDPSLWTVGFGFGLPFVAWLSGVRNSRVSETTRLACTLATVASAAVALSYVTIGLFGRSFFYHHLIAFAQVAMAFALASFAEDLWGSEPLGLVRKLREVMRGKTSGGVKEPPGRTRKVWPGRRGRGALLRAWSLRWAWRQHLLCCCRSGLGR